MSINTFFSSLAVLAATLTATSVASAAIPVTWQTADGQTYESNVITPNPIAGRYFITEDWKSIGFKFKTNNQDYDLAVSVNGADPVPVDNLLKEGTKSYYVERPDGVDSEEVRLQFIASRNSGDVLDEQSFMSDFDFRTKDPINVSTTGESPGLGTGAAFFVYGMHDLDFINLLDLVEIDFNSFPLGVVIHPHEYIWVRGGRPYGDNVDKTFNFHRTLTIGSSPDTYIDKRYDLGMERDGGTQYFILSIDAKEPVNIYYDRSYTSTNPVRIPAAGKYEVPIAVNDWGYPVATSVYVQISGTTPGTANSITDLVNSLGIDAYACNDGERLPSGIVDIENGSLSCAS